MMSKWQKSNQAKQNLKEVTMLELNLMNKNQQKGQDDLMSVAIKNM